MNKEEVLAIVREMSMRPEEVRRIVWYLEKATDSRAFNMMNIFNYGYMMGVRAERAKKKRALN